MKRFFLENLEFYIKGKLFKTCGLYSAWYVDLENPPAVCHSLKKVKQKIDLFTFFQRVPHVNPIYDYYIEPYPVSVIKIESYENWFNNSIKKKARQSIKTAYKKGVEIGTVDFNGALIKGISEIYNESPVRSGRLFPHYKDSMDKVALENGTFLERSIFLGAYYEKELIGFTKIVFEREFADILQHLGKINHRDKNATNALMAKAIEICAEQKCKYIVYGDWDDTGLGDYKRHNGFEKMVLPRYYVPLTLKGNFVLKLGLHRPISKILPTGLSKFLKRIRKIWFEFMN